MAGPEIIELQRPYARIFIGGFFFALAAVFFVVRAESNDRGLIINGIIHLEQGGADIFYAVMALCSIAFVLMAAIGIQAFAARATFRVVIGKKSLTLPRTVRFWDSDKAEEVKVRYEEMISIAMTPIGKPKVMTVTWRGGPPLHVQHFVLPDGVSLDALADRILEPFRARIEAAKKKPRAAEAEDAPPDSAP